MFSFFKKKSRLKDLIPQGFVDIHSHILYGLDDGAKSLEDTKRLIDDLQSLGFDKFIATPHTTPLVWDNTKEGISNQYQKILSELNFDNTKLRVASEYLMDESFLHRLSSEKLLTLKDNYVLVEMSYINPPIQLFEIIMELNSQGYQPILAHPERYNFYKNEYSSFKRLKQAGCLFQLNLLSTTGYYGSGIVAVAEYLLKEKMYDFVGSDVHHSRHIEAFDSKVLIKDEDEMIKLMMKNNLFI